MKRLIFLPVALIFAAVLVPFHFSYITISIFAGIVIIFFDFFTDRDYSTKSLVGYWAIFFGVLCLAIAFYLSHISGITFEALLNDRDFPKVVRRLPSFGIAFLTIGAVIVLKSIFIRR